MKRNIAVALLLLAFTQTLRAQNEDLPRSAEDIEYPISYWAPPEAFEYLRELPGGGALYFTHGKDALEIALDAVVALPDSESALTARILGLLLARSGPDGGEAGAFRKHMLEMGARFDVRLFRGCLLLGVSAPPDRFLEVLEPFLSTLKKPLWKADELAAVKARIRASMVVGTHTSGEWTDLFWATAGRGSGLFTAKSLNAINLGRLKAFHESQLHLSRLVFSLSGPARETAIVPLIQKHLINLPPPKKAGTLPKKRGLDIHAGLRLQGRDTDLTELVGAFPAGLGRGAETPALRVAYQILADRLLRRLRTTDLYLADLRMGWKQDPAGNEYAVIRFRTPFDKASRILRILFEETARLGGEKADPAEVTDALYALKRLSRVDFGWPRAKANTLAIEKALRDRGRKSTDGGIIRVSRDEIREAAKRHLDPAFFSAWTLGPEARLLKELEYAGLKEKGLRISKAKAFSPLED